MNSTTQVKSFKDEPHISYSQISSYMMCPLKYYFNYVAQIPSEFTPSALPFGGAYHEAVAFFYRGLRDYKNRYSLDALVDIFKTDWKLRNECDGNIRFDKGDTKESLMNTGIAMLKAFYENVQIPREVIAVESEFILRKADNNGSKPLPLPIVGTIDLVERDKDGKIWVCDAKTAARKYSDNKANDDLQLTIYTCAVARSRVSNGDKSWNARFDLVTKTKNPEFCSYPTTRTESDHKRCFRLIREVTTAIDAGIFFPNPGWQCSGCQYAKECKNW